MANYEIVVSASAEKSLKKIPKNDLSKIVELIQSLAFQPRPAGCRKLAGEESTYRIRQGKYRVVYEVRDATLYILVLKIGHRRDVYR